MHSVRRRAASSWELALAMNWVGAEAACQEGRSWEATQESRALARRGQVPMLLHERAWSLGFPRLWRRMAQEELRSGREE